MIWHLATIAMPTPEIIHTAWTMGLEYNVGTSSMGLNAMTALAETVGFRPGDLILGDEDGVVVLPQEHAAQIIHDAEIHMRAEADIKAAIEAGESRETATKSSRRLQHVRPLTMHAEIPKE